VKGFIHIHIPTCKQLFMIDGLCVYVIHSRRVYLLSLSNIQRQSSESLENCIILSLHIEFLTELFHFFLKVVMSMTRN
jgi:hypothetical protein